MPKQGWDARMSIKHLIMVGWFFMVISPYGGQVVNIGPYNSELGCNDWQGSACYEFSPGCPDCHHIGNGFAYPKGWPYPPDEPPGSGAGSLITPCGSCYTSQHFPVDSVTLRASADWHSYGLVYPAAGGVELLGCGKYKQSTEVKGSRCFFIGDTGE